jgi:hypothetical protein
VNVLAILRLTVAHDVRSNRPELLPPEPIQKNEIHNGITAG